MNAPRLLSPLSVQLSLTHSCNHCCIHCYNPDRPTPKLEKFDSDIKIPKLVDELSRNKVFDAVVTGGEPLTDKRLTTTLLKSLKDGGMNIYLNTNLTLMDQTFIDGLGDCIPGILTSIPSLSKDSCDKITKMNGSYNRIMNGISLCDDNDIIVGVNIVYSKYTDCTLELIEDLLKKHENIDRLSISPVIPPAYDVRNKKFKLTSEDLIKVKDMLLTIHEKYNITVGCNTPLPVCIVGNELHSIGRISACSAGSTNCTVDVSSGDVMSCFQYEHVYGNIYKDGLSECWNRMKEWNDNFLLNEECRGCSYVDVCFGECRILTIQKNSYDLNKKAVENLKIPDIPPADAGHRFRVNESMRLRKEDDGYIILSKNNYIYAPPQLVPLIDYFMEKKEFSIPEIKDDVEINDLLMKIIGIMVVKNALIDLGPL